MRLFPNRVRTNTVKNTENDDPGRCRRGPGSAVATTTAYFIFLLDVSVYVDVDVSNKEIVAKATESKIAMDLRQLPRVSRFPYGRS